jgi:hypothetical protein
VDPWELAVIAGTGGSDWPEDSYTAHSSPGVEPWSSYTAPEIEPLFATLPLGYADAADMIRQLVAGFAEGQVFRAPTWDDYDMTDPAGLVAAATVDAVHVVTEGTLTTHRHLLNPPTDAVLPTTRELAISAYRALNDVVYRRSGAAAGTDPTLGDIRGALMPTVLHIARALSAGIRPGASVELRETAASSLSALAQNFEAMRLESAQQFGAQSVRFADMRQGLGLLAYTASAASQLVQERHTALENTAKAIQYFEQLSERVGRVALGVDPTAELEPVRRALDSFDLTRPLPLAGRSAAEAERVTADLRVLQALIPEIEQVRTHGPADNDGFVTVPAPNDFPGLVTRVAELASAGDTWGLQSTARTTQQWACDQVTGEVTAPDRAALARFAAQLGEAAPTREAGQTARLGHVPPAGRGTVGGARPGQTTTSTTRSGPR